MSQIFIPLLDNSISVSHRVTTSVVRELCDKTGFGKEIEIIYQSDLGDARRVDSPLTQDRHHLKTKYDRRVYVKDSEIYEEETNASAIDFPISKDPIIESKDLGICAVPMYIGAEKNLELTFRFTSKTAMDTWCEIFALKARNNRFAYELNVRYEYSIPGKIIQYLKHVYSLLETRISESEEEFIKRITTSTHTKSNITGLWKKDIIYEAQDGVVGYFDDVAFYNTKEISEGIFSVTLNFKINYLKVVGILMEFPIIVHNQFISEEFIDDWIRPILVTEPKGDELYQRKLHDDFGKQPNKLYLGDGGKRFLDFDDFFPKNVPRYFSTLAILPIQVDSTHPKDVISIDYLVDNKLLDKDIGLFIKKEYAYVLEGLKSPYHITLYTLDESGQLVKPIEIDQDGNINTVEDMSTRKRYYLKLSFLNNLTILDARAVQRLLSSREDTIQGLKGVMPNIRSYLDSLIPVKNEAKEQFKTLKNNDFISLVKQLKETPSEIRVKTVHVFKGQEYLNLTAR